MSDNNLFSTLNKCGITVNKAFTYIYGRHKSCIHIYNVEQIFIGMPAYIQNNK